MNSVDPNRVRALVRQALKQKLGLGSPVHPEATSLSLRERVGVRVVQQSAQLSVHPSQLAIGEGPASSDCHEDMDLPVQKPCLIEPHRPCYNSGYCKKLGH